MPEFHPDEVEVLAGTHGALHWVIRTRGTGEDRTTMLSVYDGPRRVACSGFGGPALHPGRKVNEWRGRTDRLPYFVMAQAAPDVTGLVAVTDRGTRVRMTVSAVDRGSGLRFSAIGLPDGEGPGTLEVEVDGRPHDSLRQAMGPPTPPPDGRRTGGAWRADRP